MNAPTRLVAFVVALAVVFVAALGIGRAVGPIGEPAPTFEVDGHAHEEGS